MENKNEGNSFAENDSFESVKSEDNTAQNNNNESIIAKDEDSRYIPYVSEAPKETVIRRPADKSADQQNTDGRYMPYVSAAESEAKPPITAPEPQINSQPAPQGVPSVPTESAPQTPTEAVPQMSTEAVPQTPNEAATQNLPQPSAQNTPNTNVSPINYPYNPNYSSGFAAFAPAKPPEYYAKRTSAALFFAVASLASRNIVPIIQIVMFASLSSGGSYGPVFLSGIVLSVLRICLGITAVVLSSGTSGPRGKTSKSKWAGGLAVAGIVLGAIALFSNIFSYVAVSLPTNSHQQYYNSYYSYDDSDSDNYYDWYYDDNSNDESDTDDYYDSDNSYDESDIDDYYDWYYDNYYSNDESDTDDYYDWYSSYSKQNFGQNEV